MRVIDGMSTGRGRDKAVRLAALAVTLGSLSGCGNRFGAPRPASEQGSDVVDLWRMLFLVAAAIGALVAGLILWSIIRYRRKPGSEPARFHANVPLEIFYTAVPLVVVAVIFVVTMRAQSDVTSTTSTPDVRVDVTGFQWGWRFVYPDEQVTVFGDSNRPPNLVLPVGRTTRVRLSSPDVIHAFYVPAFLTKRDVVPGQENRMDVTPTEIGHYEGYCAEFCGLDHARMGFTVDVVSVEEYRAWVSSQRAVPAPQAAP